VERMSTFEDVFGRSIATKVDLTFVIVHLGAFHHFSKDEEMGRPSAIIGRGKGAHQG